MTVTRGDLLRLNIERELWWEADADDWCEGREWYASANKMARVLYRRAQTLAIAPTSVETVIGVIAALSPQCPWDDNVLLAAHLIIGEPLTKGMFQTRLRIQQAHRILAGEAVTDVLKGRKVLAFYDCICRPRHPTAVCIDRHAIDVAEGQKMPQQWLNTVAHRPPLYGEYAEAYRQVAVDIGLVPSQVQAITWVSWRRRHGRKRRETT